MRIKSEQMQVVFDEDTEYGPFCDALYIPVEQYDKMTEEEYQGFVDTNGSERISNFINVVKNPPVVEVIEPTEEDIQKEIDQIEQQKIYLENRKSELTSTMAAIVSAKIKPIDEKPIEDIKNGELEEKVL